MPTERVFFYSVHDGACYSNIELAEKVLEDFSVHNKYEINDIIELYQVKLYIDNKIFLPKWTDQDKKKIIEKVKKVWYVIVQFWNNINDTNIIVLFNQLECWTLQDSFWQLTACLSVYKRFDKDVFKILINSDKCNIRAILHQEKLVKYFNSVIKDYLLNNEESAELLLSQYVEDHDRERDDYFFPKSLNVKDREVIISRYLDKKDANLNFVRLALNIKKSENLDISDKTRLKAKRLEEKLNKEILDKNGGTLFGIQVGFSEDQEEPFKKHKEGSTDIFNYSTRYILNKDNPIAYLAHFIDLFVYLDRQNCISLVSKNSDFDTIEKIFMKSKNEYSIGLIFSRKETLSLGQIFLYDKILVQNQKQSIEELIQYYILEHLDNCFNLNGFKFNLPSKGTSYFERIRTLLAEYDVLLRQYKLYQEDGEIDNDLLCMSTSTYSLSQIPSFVTKKYCYLHDNRLVLPIHLLFSDQSVLSYVEPFKDSRYDCFYDLIVNEEVKFSNFKSFQRDRLKHLLELDYLFVDHSGIIRIKDKNQIFIIKQLYTEEVLNYWRYSDDYKQVIDKMVEDGILYFEDTLFNRLEQSYFNYYLNKKEFTNGLDLRNSFMHGTNPESENELINQYYVLLRIIVLTILKIDDDLSLRKLVKKN